MSKLPPLPDYFAYTRDDMRDYALAAVSERDALLKRARHFLNMAQGRIEADINLIRRELAGYTELIERKTAGDREEAEQISQLVAEITALRAHME